MQIGQYKLSPIVDDVLTNRVKRHFEIYSCKIEFHPTQLNFLFFYTHLFPNYSHAGIRQGC